MDVVVRVLLDDTLSIVIRVERIHKNEWHGDFVHLIKVLDLSDGKVQKGHPFSDFDSGLGCTTPSWPQSVEGRGTRTEANIHAHAGTEATIELQHCDLRIISIICVSCDGETPALLSTDASVVAGSVL